MSKNLVIVESPTKVKTIKKFLGKNYDIMASNGHVRDLPKSTLGIDVEHNFEPRYITIRGKGDLLAGLRKAVQKADRVYLATDPDREGEAISWHLVEALKIPEDKYSRISFNEITKSAVKEALKSPRSIDMDLVDAQQARRMLDRMVGYEISPLLWAKVRRGLSAGRVQSAALKMIADREAEIDAFIPKEYFTLEAAFSLEGRKTPLTAGFVAMGDLKSPVSDASEKDRLLESLKDQSWQVTDITTSRRERKPSAPFTTSTLQQEASRALNFSIQKTMRVAQQLYEGIDIKGEGTVGLITYLRTDSTRISDEAKAAAADFIRQTYGEAYLGGDGRAAKNAGRIQDAHEAIRPSDIRRTPSDVKDSLSRDQYRLYQLIWRRFAASRMSAAVFESRTLQIETDQTPAARFSVTDTRQVFDGYRLIYAESEDAPDDKKETSLEGFEKGMALPAPELEAKQHFTQPPAHFTEASLVRSLEEQGIGRPSTYSPIVSTLEKRRYVGREGRNFFVTELGEVVNGIMCESFPNIVDETFTARMERELDEVEEGKLPWRELIAGFYPGLSEAVAEAQKTVDKVKIADEVTDEICEHCGRNMVIKYGPHGRFLACPGFPECRNTKPLLEKTGVDCPKCGKPLVVRKTKKGRRFYGCTDTDCDFMSWSRVSEKRCPRCGSWMAVKGNRVVCAAEGCGYSEAAEEAN